METSEEKKQVLVAVVLVRNTEGKILLQKRVDVLIRDADNKWEFPGGKIEFTEDPQHTVKRECLEEVGCEIEVKRLLPLVQSRIWKKANGQDVHVLVVCYEALWIKGTPTPLDKKVSEADWFSEEEIHGLDLLRGVGEFIGLSK